MESELTVVDPQEMQLRALEAITGEALDLNDLSKPEAVRLFALRQAELLTELRARQAELTELRNACDKLREEREDLRVRVVETRAHAKERARALVIEIPMSAFLGYGVNLLRANPGDGVAWFMVLSSLAILVILRAPGDWLMRGRGGAADA